MKIPKKNGYPKKPVWVECNSIIPLRFAACSCIHLEAFIQKSFKVLLRGFLNNCLVTDSNFEYAETILQSKYYMCLKLKQKSGTFKCKGCKVSETIFTKLA